MIFLCLGLQNGCPIRVFRVQCAVHWPNTGRALRSSAHTNEDRQLALVSVADNVINHVSRDLDGECRQLHHVTSSFCVLRYKVHLLGSPTSSLPSQCHMHGNSIGHLCWSPIKAKQKTSLGLRLFQHTVMERYYQEHLIEYVRGDAQLMEDLDAVRPLGLPQGNIVGGCIRKRSVSQFNDCIQPGAAYFYDCFHINLIASHEHWKRNRLVRCYHNHPSTSTKFVL